MPDDEKAGPTFSEALAAAARKSGLGNVTPGELPSGRALLGAVGGIRGIAESTVPGIAFLVIYLSTHALVPAVLIPVLIALVFVVARLGARSPYTSAIAGAVLLAVTALLSILTKNVANNFVFGILTNAVFFVVLLVSLAVRWPLVGVIVGFLVGDSPGWRDDPAKRRILVLATWIWVGLFTVRLVAEVPLYFAHLIAALGVVRLVTSVPLYALCLWITWLLVRGVYGGGADPAATEVDPEQ